MSNNALPLWVSYKRAGHLLDCSIDTIKRRVADGLLERKKFGRLNRIRTESLLRLGDAEPQPDESAE
jgi:hypothetical protein